MCRRRGSVYTPLCLCSRIGLLFLSFKNPFFLAFEGVSVSLGLAGIRAIGSACSSPCVAEAWPGGCSPFTFLFAELFQGLFSLVERS